MFVSSICRAAVSAAAAATSSRAVAGRGMLGLRSAGLGPAWLRPATTVAAPPTEISDDRLFDLPRADPAEVAADAAEQERIARKKHAVLDRVWQAQKAGDGSQAVVDAFAEANGLNRSDLQKFVLVSEKMWDVNADVAHARIQEIREELLDRYSVLAENEGKHISILQRAHKRTGAVLWGIASGVMAQGLGVAYITYAPELKERYGVDITVPWFGSFDPWDQGWDQWGWDFAEPVTYFLGFGTALVGYLWFLTTRTEHEYKNMYTFIRDKNVRNLSKAEGFDLSAVQEQRRIVWLLEKELKDLKGSEVRHVTGTVRVRGDEIVDALSEVIDLSTRRSRARMELLSQKHRDAVAEYEGLTQTKITLDKKAERIANRRMHLGGVGMCTTFFLTAMGTWEWASWDLVEPITYFLTFSTVIFGATWFSTTKTEFSYDAVRDRIRDRAAQRLYKRSLFNPEHYSNLERVVEHTAEEYEALHQRVYGQDGKIMV